jgi:hypothetical protein
MALVAPPETDEAGRRIDADAAQRAAADMLLALGADLTGKRSKWELRPIPSEPGSRPESVVVDDRGA